MPKINRFQIINFRYSKGLRLLTDKIMFLNGDSTQFEATNSVGKSMQIQTLLQSICPLVDVSKKAIDIYTIKQPVYSMIEWILNDGKTILLTGIGFERKLTVSDDEMATNRKSELFKYFTFTIEYGNNANVDIENIGIIEYDLNGNKKINSLSTVENNLKNLAKSSNGKINVFPQSANSRYSEKLYEYGISQREFKDIIVKLNDGEAVLSSFFEQYCTTEKLFRNKILPLIENNLVNDNDIPRIKQQKENIIDFIQSVIDNKDSLTSYDEFKVLAEKTDELEVLLNDVIDSEKDKQESINKLSDLFYFCEQKYLELENEMNIKKDLLDNLNMEENIINFEKRSYDYRLSEDEIYKLKSSLEILASKLDDLNLLAENSITDLNTLKLREIEDDIKDCIVEKAEIEAKKDMLSIEHEEIITKMNELGSTIKYHLQNEIKDLEDKREKSKESIKDLTNNIFIKNKDIKELNNSKNNLNTKLEIYKSQESKFNEKFYELIEEYPLLNNYVYKLIDRTEIKFTNLLSDIDTTVKRNELESKAINKNIKKLKNSILSIKDEELSLKDKNLTLFSKKEEVLRKIDGFNIYKKNLSTLINDFELDELKLWDNSVKENLINDLLNRLNIDKDSLLIKKHNLEKDITKVEDGGLININESLLSELNNYGITPILGTEYLLKSKNKEILLEKNPLLPYSIIITNNEFNKLSKINFKTFSETLIPIIIREEIITGQATALYTISDGLISSKEISFLNTVDLTVLDPVLKANKLVNMEQLLSDIKNNISNISLDIEKVVKIRADLLKYKYNKNDEVLFENKLNQIEFEIDNNKELIVANNSTISNLKVDISKLEKDLFTIDKELLSNKTLYGTAVLLSKDFNEIENNKDLASEYEKDILDLSKKIAITENEINGFTSLLESEKNSLFNIDKELYDKKNIFKNYLSYDGITKLNISLDEATAKYNILLKDSSNIDISDIEKKLSQIEDRYRKLCESKDDLLFEAKGLLHLESRTILSTKKDLREKIDELNKEIKSKTKEFNSIDKKKSSKEGSLENQREFIFNTFKLNPCEKSDITDFDFINRLSLIQDEVESLNDYINLLDRNMIKVETILNDLKKYKQERRGYQIDDTVEVDMLKETLENNISIVNKTFAHNVNKYNNCLSEIEDFNTRLSFKYDKIIQVIKSNKNNYGKQVDTILKVKTYIQEQIKIYAYNNEYIKGLKESIIRDLINYCKDVVDELRVFNRLGKMGGEQYFEIKLRPESDIKYEEVIGEVIYSLMVDSDTKDVSAKIDTFYLLNKLISINALKVNVILFELNGRKEKLNWNKVIANTSGGQRFCVSFVVLTLLMEYKRYDSKKINKSTTSKVLIMDNPFGETSEEEFLIPVFQLADKFNVQIISYTHITNISVRNRFKKIYKMTVEQTVGGKEIVLIENEKIEEDEYVNNLKYHISNNKRQFSFLDEIK